LKLLYYYYYYYIIIPRCIDIHACIASFTQPRYTISPVRRFMLFVSPRETETTCAWWFHVCFFLQIIVLVGKFHSSKLQINSPTCKTLFCLSFYQSSPDVFKSSCLKVLTFYCIIFLYRNDNDKNSFSAFFKKISNFIDKITASSIFFAICNLHLILIVIASFFSQHNKDCNTRQLFYKLRLTHN